MIKTDLEPTDIQPTSNNGRYYLIAVAVVLAAIAAIVVYTIAQNNTPSPSTSRGQSSTVGNVKALPLSNPLSLQVTPANPNGSSTNQATANGSGLGPQSVNLQNNTPAGSVGQPTTSPLQSAGSGQGINNL